MKRGKRIVSFRVNLSYDEMCYVVNSLTKYRDVIYDSSGRRGIARLVEELQVLMEDDAE